MVTHPESSILHLHIVCANDRIKILNKETAHISNHTVSMVNYELEWIWEKAVVPCSGYAHRI